MHTPTVKDHSWCASWAPAGTRVVVVVLIEQGGFGAEAAAPAARENLLGVLPKGI
jgi:penicillin-binding protein 2